MQTAPHTAKLSEIFGYLRRIYLNRHWANLHNDDTTHKRPLWHRGSSRTNIWLYPWDTVCPSKIVSTNQHHLGDDCRSLWPYFLTLYGFLHQAKLGNVDALFIQVWSHSWPVALYVPDFEFSPSLLLKSLLFGGDCHWLKISQNLPHFELVSLSAPWSQDFKIWAKMHVRMERSVLILGLIDLNLQFHF